VQGGFLGNEPFDRVNDVWSTDDGETWTQATANADFQPRVGNALFAMNGKLFVLGGYMPGSGQGSDVWSSTNGATWQLENPAAITGYIYDHQVVVFNGRAWMLGGVNSNGTDGSIWSSADGITWQFEGTQAQATGRSLHRAVVHREQDLDRRRTDISFIPFNDTWSSPTASWTQSVTDPGFSRRWIRAGLIRRKVWMGGEGNGENDSHDVMWSTNGTGWRHRTTTSSRCRGEAEFRLSDSHKCPDIRRRPEVPSFVCGFGTESLRKVSRSPSGSSKIPASSHGARLRMVFAAGVSSEVRTATDDELAEQIRLT
jgi:hypothetical protein